MTPLVPILTTIITEALKDEFLDFLKDQLGGVSVNHEILKQNLKMTVGVDTVYIEDKLRQFLSDGELDTAEAKELKEILEHYRMGRRNEVY